MSVTHSLATQLATTEAGTFLKIAGAAVFVVIAIPLFIGLFLGFLLGKKVGNR